MKMTERYLEDFAARQTYELWRRAASRIASFVSCESAAITQAASAIAVRRMR